mgnify:CR=1 FL=1
MFKGFEIQLKNNQIQYNVYFDPLFDNLKYEDSEFLIVLEGCIFNKSKLLQLYGCEVFSKLIKKLYTQKKENFPNEFSGEFRGFLWDKMSNKVFIFNNHTSTQRVFYHQTDALDFYADTNLVRLSKKVKDEENTILLPNSDAFYQLISIGYVLDKLTPIKYFYRLLDASVIVLDCNNHLFKIKDYYQLSAVTNFKGTKEEALSITDELFQKAVSEEYQKDLELGKNHLTTLSGGLDSRMVLFYALNENYREKQNLFCFSQKNYTDELVAKEIAKAQNLPLEFVSLENFDFISNIDKLTKISEGLNLYIGAIHADFAMSKMSKKNTGLIHTGQLGGAILNSYIKSKHQRMVDISSLIQNKELYNNCKDNILPYVNENQSEDLFLTKNSGFNSTILGSLVFNQYSYQSSPFMNKDFLKFILSIPYEWRFRNAFYIDWVKKYCKDSTQFVWERTHMKPNSKWKNYVGEVFVRRLFNYYQYITNNGQQISMFPYQFYFEKNNNIKKTYDNYFNNHLDLLNYDIKLRKSVEDLYRNNNFFKKVFAIHILSVHKLYFS